jgi:hypothetical protein
MDPGVYIKVQREKDDFIEVDGKKIRVIRISAGGNPEHGYYCLFRGEPSEAITLLEQCLWGLRIKFASSETPMGQGKS